MPVGVRLLAPGGESEYHSEKTLFSGLGENPRVLIVANEKDQHGVFKAQQRTSAGTTILASPTGGGALALTDLMITTDKTANSSVVIHFTDDTETEVVMEADSANNTVNLAIAFAGLWRGWKDARLEMVTVDTVTATVAVGYMKIVSGQFFAEWDALR